MSLDKQALEYHATGRPGKIKVVPTTPCATADDLSLAYSPGVAAPCLAIEKDPEDAYKYTAKGNLVAVISNGSAVLGLGNIGALAGKPVMEGKGGPNFANAAATTTPTHFLHFFSNGTLTGTVIDVDDSDPQEGALVSIRQCRAAAGYPANPVIQPIAGTCSATWLDSKFQRQTTTDADGKYSFSNLPEGVWDVTTSGNETTPAGGFWRVRIKGFLDQAVADFVILLP